MMTVRHLERQWNAHDYRRLHADLFAARPEGQFAFDDRSSPVVRSAAMGLIRLDELNQSHTPLASRFLRAILNAQDADGGWNDPATTALCLRALLCGQGGGEAVERGMTYLACLQKTEGIWPAGPFRRMPSDAATSAFVLTQLSDHDLFRKSVRFSAALGWFDQNRQRLDTATLRTWNRVAARSIAASPPLDRAGMFAGPVASLS